ncbi:MAG: glycine dehydrogenase (aminomethyl-transferring) [Candidatus Muiribacterium halophilum]|uniref:Probable glycine dehydrogenase (decarboxylating) subunit 2 n=1 Tax=Muiribacterium halophilum TaxID=2053465 RepID=A0A2N5ZEC6_MUIH1|nr:MAG: glycine dehydrogenase (aminomethyl-transferring) [Candidatus Muirbacterium halophilum]
MDKVEKTIFEFSSKGAGTYKTVERDLSAFEKRIPASLRRADLDFPEVSEPEVLRHYFRLSRKNFSVDEGFYPLGSCTMKYNPKINERLASNPAFTDVHPLMPVEKVQGCLEIMNELSEYLCEIVGMDSCTLSPVAGSHGEFTGLKIIKEYHKKMGNDHKDVIILPDSAHGTNPASASMCGFKVVEVPSDKDGGIDLERLKELVDDNVAGFMVTNPSTLGLYDKNIQEIAKVFHEKDALLYYDGANLNAIMGKVKPGDMGFDIVHLNLHKTFSTPHGGGGPGAGPVGVKKRLHSFLPGPLVEKKGEKYVFADEPVHTIGRLHSFYGNFLILVRAYIYIRMLGEKGLRKTSERAVLNANYMMNKLKKVLKLDYDRTCMHEFVLSAKALKKETGVSAMDIAKRLLDFGYHAPTMYFPLIVEEALMIEPTETETKESIDDFCKAIEKIVEESRKDPEILHNAPINTPVRRVDDVQAARKPRTNHYLDCRSDV